MQFSIGVKDLAEYQGISETYLSKIFTKLKKANIVNSVPGVKGGYSLARNAENITFLDVVEAVEGSSSFFKCAEIRQNEILLDKNNLPDSYTKCPCLIKVVMLEAEEQMREYLRNKTLKWLHDQLNIKLSKEERERTIEWFADK